MIELFEICFLGTLLGLLQKLIQRFLQILSLSSRAKKVFLRQKTKKLKNKKRELKTKEKRFDLVVLLPSVHK
jgi:hypothetical protein